MCCLRIQMDWCLTVGTLWLECPSCHTMKGTFVNHCERKGGHWTCNWGRNVLLTRPGRDVLLELRGGAERTDEMKLTNWRDNLSNLPDIADAERIVETLPTGETVVHRRVLPIKPMKLSGDDPLMFVDSEGSWFVDYLHEGGPYKRRAIL